ncbi:MAG: DUF512 domain-containing protein [Candidatus Sumerlaeaceae bacterium]
MTSPQSAPKIRNGVEILGVEAGSIGELLKMKPGDRLLCLNGHEVHDILDYWYNVSAGRLTVEWWDREHNVVRKRTVRKSPHDRLGLDLEPFEIKRCNNACVFCFVHQLPRGLRPELYVKDEDYRLSFLYGNYITGTSLSEDDIDRILKLRLSPLYFSVHATDTEIRRKLLLNPHAPPILPLLKRLVAGRIAIHTQIVLCPDINDRDVLKKTVWDLAELYPGIRSIAVVPVGLTSHRQRLPQLKEITPAYAQRFLAECAKLQREVKRKLNFPLVFPSDEFFLIAGKTPPTYEEYEDIPQLENGVGMVSLFYRSLDEVLKSLPRSLPEPVRALAITSPLGAKVIKRLVNVLNEKLSNFQLDMDVRTNSLFGPGITVTGLLPGADFLAAIQEKSKYDIYLIPENSLRPWDQRFLDDITLEEIQEQSDGRVRVGGATALSFAEALLKDFVLAC